MSDIPTLNEDFLDVLVAFNQAGVRYLVVGAHALAVHGVVRATGDLDLFADAEADNACRVVEALRSFGAPLEAHGVSEDDFARKGTVYQLGLPPRRIDVLTSISGLGFAEAEQGAVSVTVAGASGPVSFRVPARESVKKNKRASGRPKDLEDLRCLIDGEADLETEK